MPKQTTGMGLRGTLAAVTTVAVWGCGPSPITSARIDRAIAPTFANLVHIQLSLLGLPPTAAPDIKVTASCGKLAAGDGAQGAGDWVCTLLWQRPNHATLRDTYDLSVATDGCYTATLDGAEGHLGGPILKASDGGDVRNLLYTFEGCFDTT
jgi:ABC-2 type transport system permease protein